MSATELPTRFVPLLPLEPASLMVCLELEQAASDTATACFVRLPGDSPHTRCLRGALVSSSGLVVAPLVVRLRQDEAAEAFFPDEEMEGITAAQDAWWRRALADLGRLQGGPPCFPELVLPAAASPLPTLPPLLFCSLSRRLFPFFCPDCLAPLTACRDDAALAAAGLPTTSGSSQRFLSCQSCCERGRDPRFWVASPTVDAGVPSSVAGLDELQRRWADALARAQAEPGACEGGPPCLRCAMVGSCVGASAGSESAARKRPKLPAAQPFWSVFSASESPYIVTRLVPASLDAFADRLGGRVDDVASASSGSGAFLFGDDGAGLDAVEVLALKLTLFLQILRCVREYHRRLGIPHLDLHPDHLLVGTGDDGPLLPALWSFRTRLLGTSGTREVTLGGAARTVLPPRETKVPFAAPRVREFCLQTRRRAELLIERVTAEVNGPGLWRFEAVLRDPHGLHLRPSSQDWILLSIPDGAEDLGVSTAPVRVDPRHLSGAGGGMRITSEPLALSPAAVRRIERSGGLHLPVVRYRVYPQFADTDDAFSLGVILLRLLLVNDRQDLSSLTDVVAATVRRATSAAPVPVRSGSFLVESALAAALAAHPAELAKANLFYRQIDREKGRPNAVPEVLWRAMLMIAFRLMEIGINPSPHPTAIDPARLDAVLAEGEGLQRQLHAVLFRRQGLNLEVQALIEELIAADPARQH